jgi:hypothetical protein
MLPSNPYLSVSQASAHSAWCLALLLLLLLAAIVDEQCNQKVAVFDKPAGRR